MAPIINVLGLKDLLDAYEKNKLTKDAEIKEKKQTDLKKVKDILNSLNIKFTVNNSSNSPYFEGMVTTGASILVFNPQKDDSYGILLIFDPITDAFIKAQETKITRCFYTPYKKEGMTYWVTSCGHLERFKDNFCVICGGKIEERECNKL